MNDLVAYFEPLTEREAEILPMLAEGDTNRQIGVRLVIEAGTVRSHVGKILAKLDAHTRTEAIHIARGLGLLPEDDALSPVAAAILVLLQCHPEALAEILVHYAKLKRGV